MRNALKAVLFVAAFSPALISVGASRIWAGGAFWDAIYYVVAGLFGALSVVYILSALQWKGEEFPFVAKKVESHDALLIGVVVTYIFPFFIRAGDVTVGIIATIGLVIAIICWITDASVPSPLLRVLGYRFYKAEAASGMVYTLISRRDILDPKNIKTVKRISGSMLLEVNH